MSKLICLGKITIEVKPVICGVPDGVDVEYSGELPDGAKFIILRPSEDWEYSDFVCMIERDGALTPVEVKKVVRYRDGGTTDVSTDAGDFHFPTPFDPSKNPTFDGKKIVIYPRERRK